MVYMLLGTGFEETEAIAPLDLLRRANVDILTVGINGKIVYGSHNIGVEADIELSQVPVIIPRKAHTLHPSVLNAI
jgi:4-methyl-5(b-hydroxyethyl)-thiazole monophosphate biosynthesis